jgi:hypothetical protein
MHGGVAIILMAHCTAQIDSIARHDKGTADDDDTCTLIQRAPAPYLNTTRFRSLSKYLFVSPSFTGSCVPPHIRARSRLHNAMRCACCSSDVSSLARVCSALVRIPKTDWQTPQIVDTSEYTAAGVPFNWIYRDYTERWCVATPVRMGRERAHLPCVCPRAQGCRHRG